MEIRSVTDLRMEDSDTKTTSAPEEELDIPRPLSPCESEISVGCENETGDAAPSSPMDMTEVMNENDEERTIVNEPSSPVSSSTSSRPRNSVRPRPRNIITSPTSQSLSPASAREEGGSDESCSYMSDEEYFRPLKRLAMSDGSPRPPSSSCTRDNLSETMSSPEPSLHHNLHQRLHQRHNQPTAVALDDRSLPSSPSTQQEAVRLGTNEEVVTPEEENPQVPLGEGDNNVALVNENNKLTAGLRSFSILDILSYRPSRRKSSIPVKIVRPWDIIEEDSSSDSKTSTNQRHRIIDANSHNNNNNITNKNNNNSIIKRSNNDRGSALDALFKMTNKTLDDLKKEDKADAVNLFNSRQTSKKKRKSRTAFTNHQIFELEKRFLYQKYLSPADRDELAQSLGLSNAQVITWFQNRRAKLKRDMEELKRDVETSKVIHNKSLLEASANVVAFLKAKELPKLHLTALHR